ncbi:DUF4105 domain-containing protein [Brucellaceae bacterium C25G]
MNIYDWLNVIIKLILCPAAFIFFIWASCAIWFQAPFGTGVRIAIICAWFGVLVWYLWAERQHAPWLHRAVFLCLALAILGWWSTIKPSLNRIWAAEVAHTVTGTIDGNMVTLNNIRDFVWESPNEYQIRWKSETYDLDTITSTDAFMSYWTGPAIAHTLVSFGFADGRHIVFSAEIRKEHHEDFSTIGGFFRNFELAMIAAEESDIIFTRTNIRGEQVYRYPIDIQPETAKQLFLSYVLNANRLAKEPAFYNTLLTNCTTVIFQMARMMDPGIVFDYRILLSGYAPYYLYDNELIATTDTVENTIAKAHINELAKGDAKDFSQRIRQPLSNDQLKEIKQPTFETINPAQQ